MKTACLCLFLLLAPALLWDASAQNTGNGVVRLYDWALSANDVENGSFAIDSLTLGYGYRIANDQPYMAFAVEWAEGSAVDIDSVSIVSLSVFADVVVKGDVVAELGLFVDSLMLASYPDLATLEYADVDWDRLFEERSEEEARAYFASGFSLENLRIGEVAFSPPLLEEPVIADNSTRRERRRGGRVIRPRGGIIIDIPIYREPPRYVPRGSGSDAGRTTQPRGEQVGRGGGRRMKGIVIAKRMIPIRLEIHHPQTTMKKMRTTKS